MKSEREREARELRAEGAEAAQQIRADADKQRVVLVAKAKQAAETLRKGDGEAIKIYADAFGQDPEFYSFYRSMLAYRKAMADEDTLWCCRRTAIFSGSSKTSPAAEVAQ